MWTCKNPTSLYTSLYPSTAGTVAVTLHVYTPRGEPIVVQLNLCREGSNVAGIAGPVPAAPTSGTYESNAKLLQVTVSRVSNAKNVYINDPGLLAFTLLIVSSYTDTGG